MGIMGTLGTDNTSLQAALENPPKKVSYFGWREGEMTFSNKDPHHGGLLCHYGCFALENQLTPSQNPLRKGLAEGAIEAY